MASTVRTKASPTIHEFDLIRALYRRHGHRTSSVIQGIGDDAAIIRSRAGQWTVLTTDLLTEGVHFDLRTATMADIGFRAAAANLSDIAAMGGTPQHLLVALAIPRTGTRRQVHQLYRGMMTACRPHHVRTHRRRYVGFERRMVSQRDADRDGHTPPGPVSERCTNRGSPLRDRHNRRFIGRPETLERTAAP